MPAFQPNAYSLRMITPRSTSDVASSTAIHERALLAGARGAARMAPVPIASATTVRGCIAGRPGPPCVSSGMPNVQPIAAIPQLAELNIGHYLVGEAVFSGLDAVIRSMRAAIDRGRSKVAKPQ